MRTHVHASMHVHTHTHTHTRAHTRTYTHTHTHTHTYTHKGIGLHTVLGSAIKMRKTRLNFYKKKELIILILFGMLILWKYGTFKHVALVSVWM